MLAAPLVTLALLATAVSGTPISVNVEIGGKGDHTKCDCTGTRDGGSEARHYICRDSRLGPTVLPRKLPLAGFLTSYDRSVLFEAGGCATCGCTRAKC
jgi:hypothetical protein